MLDRRRCAEPMSRPAVRIRESQASEERSEPAAPGRTKAVAARSQHSAPARNCRTHTHNPPGTKETRLEKNDGARPHAQAEIRSGSRPEGKRWWPQRERYRGQFALSLATSFT